jgi:hypothetical protein
VLERRIDEDSPVNRCGIKDRVTTMNTSNKSSSGISIKGLGDQIHTPCLIWGVATLEED